MVQNQVPRLRLVRQFFVFLLSLLLWRQIKCLEAYQPSAKHKCTWPHPCRQWLLPNTANPTPRENFGSRCFGQACQGAEFTKRGRMCLLRAGDPWSGVAVNSWGCCSSVSAQVLLAGSWGRTGEALHKPGQHPKSLLQSQLCWFLLVGKETEQESTVVEECKYLLRISEFCACWGVFNCTGTLKSPHFTGAQLPRCSRAVAPLGCRTAPGCLHGLPGQRGTLLPDTTDRKYAQNMACGQPR